MVEHVARLLLAAALVCAAFAGRATADSEGEGDPLGPWIELAMNDPETFRAVLDAYNRLARVNPDPKTVLDAGTLSVVQKSIYLMYSRTDDPGQKATLKELHYLARRMKGRPLGDLFGAPEPSRRTGSPAAGKKSGEAVPTARTQLKDGSR